MRGRIEKLIVSDTGSETRWENVINYSLLCKKNKTFTNIIIIPQGRFKKKQKNTKTPTGHDLHTCQSFQIYMLIGSRTVFIGGEEKTLLPCILES